ncbi:hypothetical protein YPPY91_2000, partial [Yersinia pestis PY-91]
MLAEKQRLPILDTRRAD